MTSNGNVDYTREAGADKRAAYHAPKLIVLGPIDSVLLMMASSSPGDGSADPNFDRFIPS